MNQGNSIKGIEKSSSAKVVLVTSFYGIASAKKQGYFGIAERYQNAVFRISEKRKIETEKQKRSYV